MLVGTGVCIGLNAALISIVTEWLSDLKMGYCIDGWWLNQQFCCWEIDGEEEGACTAWRTWSAYWPGRYLIYVLLAVSQTSDTRGRLNVPPSLVDAILPFISAPRGLVRKVCGRLWDIRNQVYTGRIRHERISWAFDANYQESNTGPSDFHL